MGKKEVYLDYAASAPLYAKSADAMRNAMDFSTGNPSSSHFAGRKSSVVIEQARKNIADLLHCSSKNIVFTSSGTESIYLGIYNICKQHRPCSIVTSLFEHDAVLKAVTNAAECFSIPVVSLENETWNHDTLSQLDNRLENYTFSLLCLAHANHLTGNLLPVKEIGKLCQKHHCLFFCNIIQTVGKYDIHLSDLPIDFAVASAHKFGGAKGIGLFYHKQQIHPFLQGENQERNMRAGIENIYGICGMEAALQESIESLSDNQKHIASIKSYCAEQLTNHFPAIQFVSDTEKGLYNLLSFYFPKQNMENIYIQLDIASIAVSLYSDKQKGQSFLRLSFGGQTTREGIDYFIITLSNILINTK